MDIKIDGEAAAAITSAAILQTISEDDKKAVIEQAVKALMTPERGSYMSAGQTPLQKAFDSAVNQAAYKIVAETIMEHPEVEAGINKLLGPLVTGLLDNESSRYDGTLAEAIGKAIGSWLEEKHRGY